MPLTVSFTATAGAESDAIRQFHVNLPYAYQSWSEAGEGDLGGDAADGDHGREACSMPAIGFAVTKRLTPFGTKCAIKPGLPSPPLRTFRRSWRCRNRWRWQRLSIFASSFKLNLS
jgi:hypothetical protein